MEIEYSKSIYYDFNVSFDINYIYFPIDILQLPHSIRQV